MAPRESQTIPRETVQFKILDKALDLPLVADAVSLTKTTMSPLVETITPVAVKLEEHVASFKTKAEEAILPQLSDGVKLNIYSAVDQFSAAVTSLDSLACGGLDQLTERVPVLKGPTPEVMETTKEVAASYIGLLTEYIASFTLARVALKVGETGLSMVDSTLKMTGLEEKMPISIDNVRREARALRRAGVRRAVAEFSTAETIGEVSLLGAVAEIMGVNFFLSALGLTLVPSNKSAADEATATFGMVVKSEWEEDDDEEMTVQDRLSPEKLDAYESDKDPDYAPSEASDDSLEYDSDGDVEDAAQVEDAAEPVGSAVVYEDEHATVVAEAVDEQEPVVVDTEGCDVVIEETAEAVETASLGVEESVGALPGTPLIDTKGFAAVSAAVAALEAAVVSEKPVEATEGAADTEDAKVEESKEIEVVNIEDAEVEELDEEVVEALECNPPKCEAGDNPIKIESGEDAESEEDAALD